MTTQELYDLTNEMTWEQQMKVYIHYLCKQLMMKSDYSLHWVGETYYTQLSSHGKKAEIDWRKGFSEPDVIVGELHYRYLWKSVTPISFKDFINDESNGLREWYRKFHDKIKL